MNKIIALYKDAGNNIPMKELSIILDSAVRHRMSHSLWVDVRDKPVAEFSIIHDGKNILLKYSVSERNTRAEEKEINGRIWEDSCVEFFISTDNGATYYNLEFNSEGIGLIGFGNSRYSRELLSKELIQKVETYSEVVQLHEISKWKLTLRIPVEIFIYHTIENLKNKTCKANFYKCGDLLPEPHFLAWSKIESSEPDFHLPAFFGELVFE